MIREKASPSRALRRHITKLLRSVVARVHLLRAYLGARWSGTDLTVGRGVRFYQRTIISGEGRVRIGGRTFLGYPIGGGFRSSCCELQARYADAVISLGESVGINNGLLIIAARSVEIGDGCLIGKDVQVLDFDAHGIAPEERRSSIGKISPVVLGRHVWIGNDVILLKGTRIGDNSIVAAGAVVPGGDYPPNVILGGNPARVVGDVPSKSSEDPQGGEEEKDHASQHRR